MATVFGIAVSVLTAYVAAQFNNIMDVLQLVFAFVNAPLFATFLLGMFWKRTTGHGAFAGLVAGTCAAALHHGLTLPAGAVAGVKGGWLGTLCDLSERDGAEFLDRHRRLDHLFSGDGGCQPVDAAARRARAGRAGVLADRASARCPAAVAPAAGRSRRRGAGGHAPAEPGVLLMLDIRVPVAVMFGAMGALLTGYGVFGDQSIYGRSLGININLVWGSVLLVFAACLLILSARARSRRGDKP